MPCVSGTCGAQARPDVLVDLRGLRYGVSPDEVQMVPWRSTTSGAVALHLQEWRRQTAWWAPAGVADIAPEVIRVPAHRDYPPTVVILLRPEAVESFICYGARRGTRCGVSVDGLFQGIAKMGEVESGGMRVLKDVDMVEGTLMASVTPKLMRCRGA